MDIVALAEVPGNHSPTFTRSGPGPRPWAAASLAPALLQVSVLPWGAGAAQRWPHEKEQHFWSPGQSASRVHGEVDASCPSFGQTPGLDANSPDRFRAGESNEQLRMSAIQTS